VRGLDHRAPDERVLDAVGDVALDEVHGDDPKGR
jgi:hypothetical protein